MRRGPVSQAQHTRTVCFEMDDNSNRTSHLLASVWADSARGVFQNTLKDLPPADRRSSPQSRRRWGVHLHFQRTTSRYQTGTSYTAAQSNLLFRSQPRRNSPRPNSKSTRQKEATAQHDHLDRPSASARRVGNNWSPLPVVPVRFRVDQKAEKPWLRPTADRSELLPRTAHRLVQLPLHASDRYQGSERIAPCNRAVGRADKSSRTTTQHSLAEDRQPGAT